MPEIRPLSTPAVELNLAKEEDNLTLLKEEDNLTLAKEEDNLTLENHKTLNSSNTEQKPEPGTLLDAIKSQSKLEIIFGARIEHLNKTREQSVELSRRRLRRYNITRISVVAFMIVGILTELYSGSKLLIGDFETATLHLLTASTPLIMGCAIIFYVIQGFLRDYEVALECARQAEKIDAVVTKAQIDWTLNPDNLDTPSGKKIATAIIQTLSVTSPSIESLIVADHVSDIALIQSLVSKTQTRSEDTKTNK